MYEHVLIFPSTVLEPSAVDSLFVDTSIKQERPCRALPSTRQASEVSALCACVDAYLALGDATWRNGERLDGETGTPWTPRTSRFCLKSTLGLKEEGACLPPTAMRL